MTKPHPVVDPGTAPYWAALKEKRLILKSCRACGQAHFYPREICPHCYSDDLDWIEAKGTGEIYSYTVAVRPAGQAFEADAPYTIAIVTLDEGPRMMTRIVAADADAVEIGKKVTVRFVEEDDLVLPFFALGGA
ncbi:Zn-ribbon domain-containing OB-fold protein [Pseudooceanicola sp.]|uniref:Zn-ribbon domain-containing OB-fold protein n=1 Tax=Pseudooceanicola sp. TaxID=1914328 RepID=UPI00263862C2|nr:Zn-ribbon domain-containing OB-fold protein [Pseudooceanicola sp.]MDF1857047.1 Zn-ribbon domain-containing OB-fold protein [Pseudooceanicola sp.]